MKKIMLKIAMVFTLAVVLVSCYPGDDVSVKDLDTTSTFYKKSDFQNPPKSAIIYWDVAQLKGDDGNDFEYGGEIDDEILNTALDNLVDLYGVDHVFIFSNRDQVLPVPNNSEVQVIKFGGVVPDVDAAVVPSIVLRENTSVGIIYPPCLPGYWYWYCYPPIVDVSSYGVGTVVLSMHINQSGSDLSWSAMVRGLLSSSSNGERTIKGINQAFKQSPYLN
jgi:hypothetical protein